MGCIVKKNEVALENISELSFEWHQLRNELFSRKNVDVDNFKKIFSDTYKLLNAIDGKTVDRELLGLILCVNNFATAQIELDNSLAVATLILTERMLDYCTSGKKKGAVSGLSYVYVLQRRKEFVINFNDIDESLSTLTNALDKYWDCV